MPRQTNIKWRRDTAANWSSTNPVLSAGEIGYATDTGALKIGDGATAWNSLAINTQAGSVIEYRPLNTSGAYLSGSGLVLSGLTSNYASAPDSAALSITGDIDIKVKVKMDDWTPAATQCIVAKHDTNTTRSYWLNVRTSGTLEFYTSTDGTLANSVFGTSTAATGFTDGATKWVRATLDVNDGAGNRVYKFYTSDDGTTWTQLGTTVTTAGTTSIFDSSSVLAVGGRNLAAADVTVGTIYRTIIQSAYDTANNTDSLVFDANFETATADALAFTAQSETGIKSSGLVLRAIQGQNASTPDTAALSITGDIDVKVKLAMTDWTPSVNMNIISKDANVPTTGNRSWRLTMLTSGLLVFETSSTGVAHTLSYTCSAVTGVADGATKWIRATLDVTDGVNSNCKFYLSDDGLSWTQLGTTQTSTPTSIFDGGAPVEFGSSFGALNTTVLNGTIHRAIIQSAYDTTDNTTSRVLDADFDAQVPETASFTEANGATVTVNGCYPPITINTTRYTFGIPQAQWNSVGTANANANALYYNPFVTNGPISVDMFAFEVTTTPASTAEHRIGIYRADNNCQPVGAPIADSGAISVLNGQTGVFTRQITPVTLQPGIYVLCHKSSVQTGVRYFRGGIYGVIFNIGTTALNTAGYTTQSAGAFPTPGAKWTTVAGSATGPSGYYSVIRYSPV